MGGEVGVTELLAALAADVPFAFVATAVNVYAVLFVNPVKVYGDDEAVCVVVVLAGDEVIEYPVIDDPPVALAENATDTCAFPPVTDVMLGACGTVVAVIALLADEAADVP